jgi:DNA-binding MurR/RpiR family transcriptional regulator
MDSSKQVASHPSEGHNALAETILAALPELSKKHKEIAHFILEYPDFVAFAAAAEVGIKTDTSAATVVRFSQALGYEGYLELQAAVRERMSSQWKAVQRFEERLAGPISDEDLLTHVFAIEIQNIERTAVLTAGEQLRAAAAEVGRARQVLIVGSGLAATLVEFLAYALQTMDLPTRSVTGGEEPLALALGFLQPEDVVIGISFRHNPASVLRAVQVAKGIGAKSIGIASSELSPLVQLSDYHFRVAADGLAYGPSPVAAMALLNAFISALSLGEPEQVSHSQDRIDSAYKGSELPDKQ